MDEMNTTATPEPAPFRIKDCALAALATGRKARVLQEFRNLLNSVEAFSIYHHFWGSLLAPRFEEREYNNDFASWVYHGLHDAVLAERLAALDPTRFGDLEALRRDMIELIDARLDEAENLHWVRATRQFEFLRSQIVVFDTAREIRRPEELGTVLPTLSTSSVFYHFVDARRRTEGSQDDFSVWLAGCSNGFEELCGRLGGVDPYFGSLSELRDVLTGLFVEHFGAAAPD